MEQYSSGLAITRYVLKYIGRNSLVTISRTISFPGTNGSTNGSSPSGHAEPVRQSGPVVAFTPVLPYEGTGNLERYLQYYVQRAVSGGPQ